MAEGGNDDAQSMNRGEGRRLFGHDPDGYQRGRPPYPPAAYSLMVDVGAVFPGASTLEVGAGSGLATRRLLELGADPLTVVEPDERFHAALRELGSSTGHEVTILPETFEQADLPPASFDLVLAAMSYHWLDPATRVARFSGILKPAASAVLLWNVFQDVDRPDAFHEATKELLAGLATSPSGGQGGLPFALDRTAREREFLASGSFHVGAYQDIRWSVILDTARLRALYGGFSSIARLPDDRRERLLDELCDIADDRFGGRVERNVTSVVYVFRRS